jgi:hypothetical protein
MYFDSEEPVTSIYISDTTQVFWILTIVCAVNTAIGWWFLKESYAPIILQEKCNQMSTESHGEIYSYPGQDTRPMKERIWDNVKRPVKILFTQPIVLTMAAYQV